MRRLCGLNEDMEEELIQPTDKPTNSVLLCRLSPHSTAKLTLKKTNTSSANGSDHSVGQKRRYLVSQKSGNVYQIVDKRAVECAVSALSVGPTRVEASEPESDLISDDQFFKYMGLIGHNTLRTASQTLLNAWPLRHISRVVNKDNPPVDTNGRVGGSAGVMSGVSRRTASKQQWLEEVRDNKLVQHNDCRGSKGTKKCDKDTNKESLNVISEFDFSSLMGKHMFRQLLCEKLNELQKYMQTLSVENYCLCDFSVKMSLNANIAVNYMPRITRHGSDWSSRHKHHIYCFNRQQRLEKWRRFETGLNWRSRLLKKRCRRLTVRLNRMTKCPICTKTIDFNPRHQCWQFDAHLRPQPLPNQYLANTCHSKDSSHEIIIIGDDFMDEEMDQQISCEPIVDNINSEEVIKASDSDDDDVMIIKEVLTPKPSISIKFSSMGDGGRHSHPVLNNLLTANRNVRKPYPLTDCNHLPTLRETNISIVSKSYSNRKESNDTKMVYGSHF
ncbi:unnamed protein product [Medioppia subpectinata]|uniref:Uncharacterized protein n=1 Tax=Medioppia subpectinata TaxID=1979941 RepID=A0A7R9KWA8_9ACAR|nr:unnamed protein product [Medioppia subpectinata]CAG2110690.1 unnamed protein product [Medioppia subpectinata]